jgi:hypothetical protein
MGGSAPRPPPRKGSYRGRIERPPVLANRDCRSGYRDGDTYIAVGHARRPSPGRRESPAPCGAPSSRRVKPAPRTPAAAHLPRHLLAAEVQERSHAVDRRFNQRRSSPAVPSGQPIARSRCSSPNWTCGNSWVMCHWMDGRPLAVSSSTIRGRYGSAHAGLAWTAFSNESVLRAGDVAETADDRRNEWKIPPQFTDPGCTSLR